MADAILSHCATKVCKTCGETKSLPSFAKAASCLDGHRGSCKSCGAAGAAKRSAAWRARHPERAKEVDARYREVNPEKVKATRAAHYQRNSEAYREKSLIAYHANKDLAKARNAAWLARNKDRRSKSVAAWKAANKDKVRIAYARWHAENPEARRIINRNRRARKLGNGGKLSKGISAKLFKIQRGLCACCKEPLGDDYHMDHIMPLLLGGENSDCNMQLLRSECNLKKKAKHPVDYMRERGYLL